MKICFPFELRKIPLTIPLIIISLISFGPMLVNSGLHDDGWAIFLAPLDSIYETCLGFKLLNQAHIFTTFKFRDVPNGILWLRFIAFALMLAGSLFFYYSLKSIKFLTSIDRVLLAFLFIVMPINAVRVSIINILYCGGFVLLWMGTFFAFKFAHTNKLYARLIALLCFTLAFTVNSILVFYIVPFTAMLLIKCGVPKIRVWLQQCLKWIDFIIAPFAYYIFERTFFADSTSYYALKIDPLKHVLQFAHWAYKGIFQRLHDLLFFPSETLPSLVVLGLAFALTAFIIKNYPKQRIPELFKHYKIVLLSGAAILVFSLFPYFLVIRSTDTFGPDSRHELLAGLGLCLITLGAFGWMQSILRIRLRIMIFMISLMIIKMADMSCSMQMNYLRGSHKTSAIINSFKQNKEMDKYTTFEIHDHSVGIDRIRRRFLWSYNGMLGKASGRDDRFIFNAYQQDENNYVIRSGFKKDDPVLKGLYFAKNYKLAPIERKILLTENKPLTLIDTAILTYKSYFDKESYNKEVADYINVSLLPMDEKIPTNPYPNNAFGEGYKDWPYIYRPSGSSNDWMIFSEIKKWLKSITVVHYAGCVIILGGILALMVRRKTTGQ